MMDQPLRVCRRVLCAAAALGLLMTAGRAGAQAPTSESSAITKFWESVAEGVASDIAGLVAGWALSAIGISGSDGQELADLSEIIDLLEQIDAELSTIESDFENLKCEEAQNAEGLTHAITVIGGLYDRYTDFVRDFDKTHAIPDWQGSLGVQLWLNDIFDPTAGVQAQLIAMQNALMPPAGTGVISECVEFIVDTYQKGEGPTKAVFDWTGDESAPGVYDLVQQLTDYYYLYQTWAAVLLVEAYHVQACLDLESGTPGADRNCTFGGNQAVTPQTSVTSDTAYNLCKDPANNRISGDCLSAQSALTNLNDNGAYDGLRHQLIAAGAPYSNALLGKVMASTGKTDVLYPRSLEDFTNNATADGTRIQTTPCAVPLTSAKPCGFTVGAWNMAAPGGTTYGTVRDTSGKVLFDGYSQWAFGNVSDEGASLVTLLANYNAKTAGDTGGTLGQWMASVGFIDNTDAAKGPLGNPRLKIVLTGEDHKTGDEDAVCTIDTNIDQSSSVQPWCAGDRGASDNLGLLQKSGGASSCGPGCLKQKYVAASYTSGSAAPAFYTADMHTETDSFGTDYKWSVLPGWVTRAQTNTALHQFHWPSLAIQKLPSDWCTVSNKGTPPADARNPGGVLTMCGPDLEAWLGVELAKPPVSLNMAIADTTLYQADRNRNDGAGLELALVGPEKFAHHGRGGRRANQIVVRFDAKQVQSMLAERAIGSARLVLTPAAADDRPGYREPLLAAYPLRQAFEEGTGNAAESDLGAGPGATWNCAIDAEIGDDVADCVSDWPKRRRFAGPPDERPALSPHKASGALVFDVGDHVASGITAWIIEPFDRRSGRHALGYISREGATARGDLGLAPTLVLTTGATAGETLAAGAGD